MSLSLFAACKHSITCADRQKTFSSIKQTADGVHYKYFSFKNKLALQSSIDISSAFNAFTSFVVKISVFILSDVLNMNINVRGFTIFFDHGNPISIVWGCSGLKQMFIFSFILIFSFGSWKNKLWFVPIGLIICFFVNILRIIFLALIAYSYPNNLDLFHTYIFKYLFYAIIFIIFLIWEEKYGYASKKNKSTEV